MSNLKEIRTRIQSVAATRKITSAMKMVSAAKFHKAQEVIARYKPYAKKTYDILNQIAQDQDDTSFIKWFRKVDRPHKAALVVITSNSSMCGGFNQNILKKVSEDLPRLLPELWGTNELEIYCLGKKGNDFFNRKGYNIKMFSSDIIDKPSYSKSAQLADLLSGLFINKEYDAVYVVYNIFKNPALQEPVIEKLLPISIEKSTNEISADFIYEPSKSQIAEVIIPKTVKVTLHRYILESSAGEHGARMTAMHQATDNATDIIQNLTLQYNKARQAAITKEILEIVSGAEALKG
jgi:F-type H+-transporting ATPase subunit gamma